MAIELRSFFIGIGTVLAILAVGFGGGVMIGGMMSGTPHQPNKVERQAAKDAPAVRDVAAPALPVNDAQPKDLNTLARNIDAIKPTDPKLEPASQTQAVTQPQPVAPQATAPSQVIQPPGPPAQTAIGASQPAAELQQPLPTAGTAQAAPTSAAVALASPPLGPERQVSLPRPTDETRPLTRREQHRIERAQRREERHRLFAERRQQELQRREEERAAAPRPGLPEVDDDGDGPPPRRVYMRPRGLFDGLFSSFR